MNLYLIKVHLTVDSPELEAKVREQVEYAMNKACSFLENQLKHESISYKIRELEEI